MKYRFNPVTTTGKWEMTQLSIIQPAITFWYFLSHSSCCISSFERLFSQPTILKFPYIPESAKTGLIANSVWIYHSNKFRCFSLSVLLRYPSSEIEILDAVRAQPACELTLTKLFAKSLCKSTKVIHPYGANIYIYLSLSCVWA